MHAGELGICKNFLNFFFTQCYANDNKIKKEYYLTPDKKALVQQRVDRIVLPHCFTRGCRSFDFFSDFKAFEFKTIMFYTCKHILSFNYQKLKLINFFSCLSF